MKLTIYGASDDLLEIESDTGYQEEFDVPGGIEVLVEDRTGACLVVRAEFGVSYKYGSEWTLSVRNTDVWPLDWTFQYSNRPDRDYDPALILTVPEGTTVRELASEAEVE